MSKTDRRNFLKAGMGGVLGLAAVPMLGSLAGCQSQPATRASRISLQTQALTPRVRVVSGAPGNVVVLDAADGLVLVDSGSVEAAPALQALLDGNVRTLINTHYHADQTGGNALFGAAGAEIRAQTITRQWLAAPYWSPAQDRYIPAPPKEAVPKVTFRDKGEMTAGSERIEYGYLLEAHTRGDAYVFFRDSNVLVAGDVASPERDPELDWFAGGWLGGRVDAMDDLLELANDETRIVPAYGPVMSKAELQAERDLMNQLFDITAGIMTKGGSAKDMLDQGVMDQVPRRFKDPYKFFYDISKGYQAHYTNVGVNVV
jgi:cyclase